MIAAKPNVLEFDRALEFVRHEAESLAEPLGYETVGLLAARGRVLAREIKADRDQPPFDRATRDGFGVRAGEFSAGKMLEVVGSLRAGAVWGGGVIGPGYAVEIMTGAAVPEGADAVAMVEHAVCTQGAVRASEGQALSQGENVVRRGSEARLGATVVPAGTRIWAAEIALGAACGYGAVEVFRRPQVAIVATGDELVEVDVVPGPRQIRNSNSYALAAMVEAAGGEAVRLRITPDERGALAASLRAALAYDVVVLSGGVSMGEYDLVEEMLLSVGAEFLFTGVRMQPGKPAVFGRLPERDGLEQRYFFGLPGNPISTQVTFHCFVEPFVRAMAGEGWQGPRWAQATLVEAVSRKDGLTRLLPARMSGVAVRVVGWQGSGDLAANGRANCYAELLPGQEYGAGDVVRVLLR